MALRRCVDMSGEKIKNRYIVSCDKEQRKKRIAERWMQENERWGLLTGQEEHWEGYYGTSNGNEGE